MPLTQERLQDAYRQMLVIRKFEETIRNLYQQGKIRGSFHPCVGQEATAVGGCWALRKDDYMTCTYRGHGQAIAKGLSVRTAMAEMLGKITGCSKGKGGSMHFTDTRHAAPRTAPGTRNKERGTRCQVPSPIYDSPQSCVLSWS